MSNRRLVLFCSIYPSDKGERFLSNEMDYIRSSFDEVIVVTDNQGLDPKEFKEKTIIYQQPKLSLRDILSWKNKRFLIEIFFNILSFSVVKSKISIKAYLMGLAYKKFVIELIDSLNQDLEETLFYSYWFNDATIGLSLLRNERKIKYSCRVHRWDLYEEENLGDYLPFRNPVGKTIDRIFSISEDGINYLRNRYPSLEKALELARLGVKDYGKPSKNRVESDYKTIVSCSNVIPVKRVDMIANAIAELKTFKIRWIHFGGGSDFESLKRISSQVAQENPNLKIELRGGTDNEKLIEFYHTNKVDLFLNVSWSEGIPVSIMEAMEAGIPVMATNVGGTEEIFTDKLGSLLDVNVDPIKLSEMIRTHLNQGEGLNEMSKASRSQFELILKADQNYSKFSDALKQV